MTALHATHRVLATLFALALVALGLLVSAEIVAALAGQAPLLVSHDRLATRLQDHSWQSTLGRTASVVALVAGLLLLLVTLRRGAPSTLPLTGDDPQIDAGLSRRSLQGALRRWAAEIDGVSSARARVGRRRATVRAVTLLRDPGDLEEQVRRQINEHLDGLGLRSAPRLRVRLLRKSQ